MLNDLLSLRDVAINSVKYFQNLVENLKLENTDYLPRKSVEKLLDKLIENDVKSILNQSKFRWLNSKYVSFVEFWRIYEELLQLNGKIQNDTSKQVEDIINGMIYLRNKIIDKSVNDIKQSDLVYNSYILGDSKVASKSKISLFEIRQIIQGIISEGICNDISSTYWSDVLSQIPTETNYDIFLDILDISNSILQWLKEFLITPTFSPIETANTLLTRIITLKDVETNNLLDSNETGNLVNIDKKRKSPEIVSEGKNRANLDSENANIREFDNEFFESLPWKGQTMFSNFRELQISLQYLLERVSLVSNGEIGEFSRRDELSIRKISHMVTELEDFLYHQFDIRQKEKNNFQVVEAENIRLKKQLRNIVEELEDKNIELSDSISQKNKFEKEVECFFVQKNKLSADIIRLRDENKILEKKYEGTLSKLNKLIEEHMTLKDEYALLRTELNQKNERNTCTTLNENILKNGCEEDKKKNISCSLCGDVKTNKYPYSNINTFYYRKNDIDYSSEIKETHSKVNLELPATITSLPEFLESETNYPIKLQNSQLEKRFPVSSIGKLRTVEVVPTIIQRYNTNASIVKRISRKMNSNESNSLRDKQEDD
ncbi:hypothetical protein FG379_002932 [Cryptosporidium bovis]|uniref:uncharacterized protein n=1 Tax=Cryptosporidium bovis TaxID=310047 RepID=UPI00351A3E99|nr:hypothetical protein FG379_002932 [Cryptosporidium bovis]